jgi:hypothetical protein
MQTQLNSSNPLLLDFIVLSLVHNRAGVVAEYTGAKGVIGMHGGLPPPDAFPFATLGGDLVPEPSSSSAAAPPAGEKAAAAAGGSSALQAPPDHLQRLDITDPVLVALAQQYIMTPKVQVAGSSDSSAS